jgi:hypothetical protein
MAMRPGPKLEPAVTIGTLDEALVSHFQKDARMTERTAAPIAADAGIVNRDYFGRFDGHGLL